MLHNVSLSFWLLPTIIFCSIGYIIGSVNIAVLISKKLFKSDIRVSYSGNAGATNMTRKYGYKYGISVLMIDMIKGFTPTLICVLLQNNVHFFLHGTVLMAMIFTFIGHSFPVFHKFKGGKNVACFGGAIIFYSPIVGVFVCFLSFIILLIDKRASVSSLIASLIAALIYWIIYFIANCDLNKILINNLFLNHINEFNDFLVNTVILTVAVGFLWWRHKENIKKIVNGQEKKINLKNPQKTT